MPLPDISIDAYKRAHNGQASVYHRTPIKARPDDVVLRLRREGRKVAAAKAARKQTEVVAMVARPDVGSQAKDGRLSMGRKQVSRQQQARGAPPDEEVSRLARSEAAARAVAPVRRRQLVGERLVDKTRPGENWSLRAALRPLDYRGMRYFVNSALPGEIVEAPNYAQLFRTHRIEWAEPGRPPGPAPQPLPPVKAAPPRPEKVVVIRDHIRDVINWRKTKAHMTALCGGDAGMAMDMLLGDRAGSALWAAASKEWQNWHGARGRICVPYSFDSAEAKWLDSDSGKRPEDGPMDRRL